jgi:hypothetical protein
MIERIFTPVRLEKERPDVTEEMERLKREHADRERNLEKEPPSRTPPKKDAPPTTDE